jgi:hypothetical protein
MKVHVPVGEKSVKKTSTITNVYLYVYLNKFPIQNRQSLCNTFRLHTLITKFKACNNIYHLKQSAEYLSGR